MYQELVLSFDIFALRDMSLIYNPKTMKFISVISRKKSMIDVLLVGFLKEKKRGLRIFIKNVWNEKMQSLLKKKKKIKYPIKHILKMIVVEY